MKIIPPFIHTDARGKLIKVLKSSQIPPHKFGEAYIATSAPGIVRGNHYHKVAREWFYLIQGEMLLLVENTTTKEKEEVIMKLEISYEVLPGFAHALKNIGHQDALFFAYTTHEFAPNDTIPYPLLT